MWISDLEGRWDKLVQAADGEALRLGGAGPGRDELRAGPGFRLVHGGDVVDRGPAGLRLLRTLVDAHDADGAVLLAGNRDINKLRLPRELGPAPRPDAPAPVGERLRWTLSRTMGAGSAWAWRAAELGVDPADESTLVLSLLDDVGPEGPLLAYLKRAKLIFRKDETLFAHGAVLEESLGVVPGVAHRIDDLGEWIEALNQYYDDQIAAFCADPLGVGHLGIIGYQAPRPGTREHQASVVYGRPTHPSGQARLPSPATQRLLKDQGIRRLVLGHTPMGDCPSVLRQDGFEQILGDTSYSPLEAGPRVRIRGDRSWIRGEALASDEHVHFELDLRLDTSSDIGEEVAAGEHRRARLTDRRELCVSFQPGWRVVQRLRGPAAGPSG